MSTRILSLKIFTGALKTAASTIQVLLYFLALLLYFFTALIIWMVTSRVSAEEKVM